MTIKHYKYAENLEKKITKYLKKFKIHRAICSNEFFYSQNNVYFTIFDYKTNQNHINFINDAYQVNITNWYFIFSLLHEVGHHMTVDQLTSDDIFFEFMMRQNFIPFLNDNDKRNNAYFNLPAEDLANKWAIDYIIDHERECWEFQEKCLKMIEHIYKKKCFTY